MLPSGGARVLSTGPRRLIDTRWPLTASAIVCAAYSCSWNMTICWLNRHQLDDVCNSFQHCSERRYKYFVKNSRKLILSRQASGRKGGIKFEELSALLLIINCNNNARSNETKMKKIRDIHSVGIYPNVSSWKFENIWTEIVSTTWSSSLKPVPEFTYDFDLT